MTTAARPHPAAARTDRRQFLIGGALLAAACGTALLRPQRVVAPLEPGALDAAVPKAIGRYRFLTASGLVLPPQDEMSEQIYDQVLTRVYTADGLLPMMLLIAYGSAQDYTLQAHLPEVCYPSSGYTLTDLDRVPVRLRGAAETATFLTAERSGTAEQVLYWVRIGRRYPSSLTEQRLAVLGSNLQRTLPDGILVRVSTLAPSREEALPQMQAFNQLLLRSIPALGQRLFFGAEPR